MKRVVKAKPLKKIPETDAIFENVREVNRKSDGDTESLRISVDSKAEVSIGEFSRNGKSRDKESKKAWDHDMKPVIKFVPFGILNMLTGVSDIFFGISSETGDFISDCIESWWDVDRVFYSHIKEPVINTDCVPDTAGNRLSF